MSDESLTGVLAGRIDPSLSWLVLAGGTDEHFMTWLEVYRDGKRAGTSGMGGPKLYPGSPIHEFRGRTDDLPYFVMARVAPEVDRVVATTDRGTEVELKLSPLIEDFNLRFAAAPLPDGEEPGRIRAESQGIVLTDESRPMHHRPPGH